MDFRFKIKNLHDQSGMSLIEVMIAVLISFLIVAGIYAVFTTQNKSTIRTEQKNELTSAVNSSYNIMIRDIRMAGYHVPPQAAVSPISNFNNGGTLTAMLDYPSTGPLILDATYKIKTGTDALLVLYSDNLCSAVNFVDNSAIFTNGNSGTARICEPNCFTATTNQYKAGDIILVTASTGSIFVKVATVTLNQATAGVCSGATYSSVTYTGLDEIANWYRPGASYASDNPTVNQELTRLQSRHLYYVSADNKLMRLPIEDAGSAGTIANAILADNVEDLQFRFDMPATACANCDPASEYHSSAGGMNPANLSNIRSVHIGMISRAAKADVDTFKNRGAPMTMFDHAPTATPDSFRRLIMAQMIRVKNLEILDFGS